MVWLTVGEADRKADDDGDTDCVSDSETDGEGDVEDDRVGGSEMDGEGDAERDSVGDPDSVTEIDADVVLDSQVDTDWLTVDEAVLTRDADGAPD